MEYKSLINGVTIPMVGLGVYMLGETEEETTEIIFKAIKLGYRLIDTAASYRNEESVGNAVRRAVSEGVCTREDLFISTKIHTPDMSSTALTAKAIDTSLNKSGLEYFDLILLHYALNDYFAAWRALEEAYKNGKAKAIGVSNFYGPILTNLCESARIHPMVNQIETHPFYVRTPDIEVNNRYDIVTVAWAPLGGRGATYNYQNNRILRKIAKRHKKSIPQVMLKWNLQRGIVVIPKSSNEDRLKSNLDLFDFKLTDEEMKMIASLDMGYSDIRIKQFDNEFIKARLGVNVIDFNVLYHEDDNSEPAKMTTRVVKGQKRNTLTLKELNFETTRGKFKGWKVYREVDASYRVKDKAGNKEWMVLEKGVLPDDYDFLLYKEGEPVQWTASEGNVHFYGVWE